jgi:hypothetical protein
VRFGALGRFVRGRRVRPLADALATKPESSTRGSLVLLAE